MEGYARGLRRFPEYAEGGTVGPPYAATMGLEGCRTGVYEVAEEEEAEELIRKSHLTSSAFYDVASGERNARDAFL